MSEHAALLRTKHRPWPLPTTPWRWRQSWCDLLFAHWPVPASVLQPLVPDAIRVQEFDGTSWMGIVPFRMEGVMRRPLPDVPGLSAFPELNVRLYVEHGGKPGVWFLSLDAFNHLAVWAARRFFHLPYFHARMQIEGREDGFEFQSTRSSGGGLSFSAIYQPTSGAQETVPGSLEHWLTERYSLYAQSPTGHLYRTEVHHVPWPLQSAEAEIRRNEMLDPFGIAVSGPPALLHFAERVDVVAWQPTRL